MLDILHQATAAGEELDELEYKVKIEVEILDDKELLLQELDTRRMKMEVLEMAAKDREQEVQRLVKEERARRQEMEEWKEEAMVMKQEVRRLKEEEQDWKTKEESWRQETEHWKKETLKIKQEALRMKQKLKNMKMRNEVWKLKDDVHDGEVEKLFWKDKFGGREPKEERIKQNNLHDKDKENRNDIEDTEYYHCKDVSYADTEVIEEKEDEATLEEGMTEVKGDDAAENVCNDEAEVMVEDSDQARDLNEENSEEGLALTTDNKEIHISKYEAIRNRNKMEIKTALKASEVMDIKKAIDNALIKKKGTKLNKSGKKLSFKEQVIRTSRRSERNKGRKRTYEEMETQEDPLQPEDEEDSSDPDNEGLDTDPAAKVFQKDKTSVSLDKKSVSCTEPGCGAQFRRKDVMVKHVKIVHKKERHFYCTKSGCGAKFKENYKLLCHVKIVHEKQTPFQCPEKGCGAKFGRKNQMLRHVKTVHEKQTPFPCLEKGCGAKFWRKDQMLRHVKTVHEKQTPFICLEEGCGAMFGQKSDMLNHVGQVHRKERMFLCTENECDASYKQNRVLSDHMRSKHGHPKLVCGVQGCNKAFVWSSVRFKHKRLTHSKTE